MSPEELKRGSRRTENKEAALDNSSVAKDIMEIDTLQAAQALQGYQEETRSWRNRKVTPKEIVSGDLVLRRSPTSEGKNKLFGKWEGPYVANAASRPGPFHLTDSAGVELPHTWNIDNLKKYYA
ncbi:unnamed protein product [Urochloa humidicola]